MPWKSINWSINQLITISHVELLDVLNRSVQNVLLFSHLRSLVISHIINVVCDELLELFHLFYIMEAEAYESIFQTWNNIYETISENFPLN